MKLISLFLSAFRNIEQETLRPGQALTLLSGLNGQGKTSFVEAISLLSIATSFRTQRDDDMIAENHQYSRVHGIVETAPGSVRELAMDLKRSSGKTAWIDGQRAKRLGDFTGTLPSVLIHPGDIDEIRGAPALRRKFMDMGISMASRDYLGSLRELRTAMESKRAILSKVFRGTFTNMDRASLRAINETAVHPTWRIVKARSEFVSSLSATLGGYWKRILRAQGPEPRIRVDYKCFLSKSVIDSSESDLLDLVRRNFDESLKSEIDQGKILTGSQRDDFEFFLNNRPARRFASQGEARTMVVGSRLFLADEISRMRGERPLVLVDDVLTDLDRNRRHGLMECLAGTQVVATVSDCTALDRTGISDSIMYIVENGGLTLATE
ncbi:MAG: hypothetical protein CVV64_01215 [Candidatus Wallbacteria bacterium HGW-Wallbacteria-1]|jgi:DNA replication and repair protein RecF|uniref:DNA replication and repair protein RecF n=1 Tax=Candidatus Wallbacteria bacterium HGW-Wallbacteria-1 TaxID=2013854 RepID=A0A2N1PUQ6_9BACT|nr:MAG: hypothetical protein CVV64_01215 [Candidatus Wallbacteria bacterium HGW-Wallbacteria-1]